MKLLQVKGTVLLNVAIQAQILCVFINTLNDHTFG